MKTNQKNSKTSSAFKGSILHFLSDPEAETEGKGYEYFEDGLLFIEDGIVKSVGPFVELEKNLPKGTKITDYGDKLIMPGFIDTHLHYPQTDIIGSFGKKLLEWLEKYTFPVEGKFKDTDYANEVADFFLEELLRNGTTTAHVMCTVHKHSAEILFQKSLKKNLRMILGKVMMDRNAPEFLLDTPESGYNDSLELIEQWHEKQRLLYSVTPRFAITSTEEQLKKSAELLTTRKNLYLHTHLAENKDEIEFVAELFPWSKNYLDVYDKYGLVNDKSMFAHCVYLSKNEYRKMEETGASISFCPTSNLFLGSGLFDMDQSWQSNIKVGIGTDIGGGTSFSILKTLGEAYKVLQQKSQTLSPLRAFYLATLGGAKSLSLNDKIGNFESGKEADFVVLNFNATPLIERRLKNTADINERLFILMILGDDRSIEATHIMGEKVYAKA